MLSLCFLAFAFLRSFRVLAFLAFTFRFLAASASSSEEEDDDVSDSSDSLELDSESELELEEDEELSLSLEVSSFFLDFLGVLWALRCFLQVDLLILVAPASLTLLSFCGGAVSVLIGWASSFIPEASALASSMLCDSSLLRCGTSLDAGLGFWGGVSAGVKAGVEE